MAEFEKVEAAIAPIYAIDQIFEDPQYKARESVTWIDDEDLGKLAMQNVFPVMSRTPGAIRHGGPRLGQHTREILDALIDTGSISKELAQRVETAFKERAASD